MRAELYSYDQMELRGQKVAKAHKLLTGKAPNQLLSRLADNERIAPSSDVLLVPKAPHQSLFPRASVTVHHGGVGTTGQGLRAGRPSLIVPHAHDQADNADRVVRLGAARSIPAADYQASTVTRELGRILNDPAYSSRAAEIGRRVVKEDGAAAAADAIERLLMGTR